MATNKQILYKMSLIEKMLGFPKGMELHLTGAYGKSRVETPDYQNLTPLLTKRELYNTLDAYLKGMEDYKNRVKLKQKFKKRMK